MSENYVTSAVIIAHKSHLLFLLILSIFLAHQRPNNPALGYKDRSTFLSWTVGTGLPAGTLSVVGDVSPCARTTSSIHIIGQDFAMMFLSTWSLPCIRKPINNDAHTHPSMETSRLPLPDGHSGIPRLAQKVLDGSFAAPRKRNHCQNSAVNFYC